VADDETIYDAAGVRLTAERLTFGGRSYALADLTAARAVPDGFWPGCAAGCLDFGGLLAGALAGAALDSFAVFAAVWLTCSGTGLLVLFAPPRYKLVLVTPAGEVAGPRGLARESSEAITAAVSRAIERRG